MNLSHLKPLSILCGVCFLLLGVFQLGALYGSSPYRALVLADGTKQAFLQVGLNQSHSLYLLAIGSTVFALLNFIVLTLCWMQERKKRA